MPFAATPQLTSFDRLATCKRAAERCSQRPSAAAPTRANSLRSGGPCHEYPGSAPSRAVPRSRRTAGLLPRGTGQPSAHAEIAPESALRFACRGPCPRRPLPVRRAPPRAAISYRRSSRPHASLRVRQPVLRVRGGCSRRPRPPERAGPRPAALASCLMTVGVLSAPMTPFKALGAGREQGCESLRRAGAPRPMRGRHRVRPTAVPRRRLSRLVPENKTPAPASLSFQSASGVGRAGLQGLRCSNGRCSNGHSNRWSRSEIIMRGMYGFITDQASGI